MKAKSVILFALTVGQSLEIANAGLYGWSDRTVEESSPMSASKDPDWWVNSGAYFTITNGIGQTVMGKLPEKNPWRRLYATSNPEDTDGGYRPQNIARFVTRQKWGDASQEVYFRIVALNKSETGSRDASNGILFFNRYQSGDDLYYSGIRVDGRPVIKKKTGGTYVTLSYPRAVYPGKYNRTDSPNLIPEQKWIGIKSTTENVRGKTVLIRLYLDREAKGKWELIAEATDDVLTSDGYGGLRSDFMDVQYRGYAISPLK